MRGKPLSGGHLAYIIQRLQDGVPAAKVARDLGVCYETIWGHARKMGLPRRTHSGRYPRVSDQIREKIVNGLKAGEKAVTLAARHKVDPSFVSVLKKRAGLPMFACGRKPGH